MGTVFFNQIIMILNTTKNYFEFSRQAGGELLNFDNNKSR